MASTVAVCHLDHLRLIRVSGPDRGSFLQGQLTQDVRTVGPDRCALYGWTTAQGRLIATGLLLDWRESLWLSVSAASAADVVRRLQLFVLRARVSIEISPLPVLGLAAGNATTVAGTALAAEAGYCAVAATALIARLPTDAARAVLLTEEPQTPALLPDAAALAAADWRLADIRAGLPTIEPATADAFLPQMVNLDVLGGVSFSKGCYTGQEIVTRTRNLGRVKRRMVRLRSAERIDSGPNAEIFSASGSVGRVLAASADGAAVEMLAVVALDAATGALFADAATEHPLTRLDLPYAVPDR